MVLLVLVAGLLAPLSELLGVSGAIVPKHCTLPPEHGKCKEKLLRYYYDVQMKTCRPFTGCQAGGNNFKNIKECVWECEVLGKKTQEHFPLGKPPRHCTLPPTNGKGKSRLLRYYYDVQMKTCHQFTYRGDEGNRNNFKSFSDCIWECDRFDRKTQEGSSSGSVPKHCTLPLKQGPCKAAFPRYYYNTQTNKCEKFIYGGCKGNANNFLEKEDCAQECHSVGGVTISRNNIPKHCTLPLEQGPCKAAFPRYYYNTQTNKCEKFIYGGCKGNANNFLEKEDCAQECHSVGGVTISRNNIPTHCSLPPEQGFCKAAFPRYYYNTQRNKCEKFIYGGCNGNANNFQNMEDCTQECYGIGRVTMQRS
ncbi:actinia tenebrosa protease inhibitors-like [Eublepharis macularius]|uniref:Actinia tenebrosa protease inhibitors-like n=1 Tax=Eublepharis macularius TaxID=481883 RepID=A0AA97LFW6_EUBMA|nr:actinia tenebrosa protease inhibitors-like [Eublepharis macularius]